MAPIKKLSPIILVLCIMTLSASAQESTLRVISLAGDTLQACRIDSLSENILFGSCSGKSIFIPIDSIAIVERFKEGDFLKGATIGTLAGAAAGAIIGYATYQKPGPKSNGSFTIDLGPGPAAFAGVLLGGVGGFVIGGVIGASSDQNKIDLRGKKTVKMKRMIILQIFVN
jgi:hypothetical protein